MDIEQRLKQKLKEERKISIIIGSVVCAILCALIIIIVVNRVAEVESESAETTTWLNFGIVGLSIILIAVFTKYILLVYMDSKKGSIDQYENIKIVVLQVNTKMRLLYGTWSSNALVENLETGEQFLLEGCGDMKENEKYCMLRAKHSKLFVYEPFDDSRRMGGRDVSSIEN